jgi:hypothetical protein
MGEEMIQGWQCPLCGRVNAPWKTECDCTNRTFPNHPLPCDSCPAKNKGACQCTLGTRGTTYG